MSLWFRNTGVSIVGCTAASCSVHLPRVFQKQLECVLPKTLGWGWLLPVLLRIHRKRLRLVEREWSSILSLSREALLRHDLSSADVDPFINFASERYLDKMYKPCSKQNALAMQWWKWWVHLLQFHFYVASGILDEYSF